MNKQETEASIKEFMIDKKLEEKAQRTINQYERVLNLFIEILPEDKEITKTEVLLFKEEMQKQKYSIATYNNYVTIINSFFKYSGQEKLYLKKIKVQQQGSLEDVLEPIDYKRLMRWAKKMNMEECRLIMYSLAETGARIAELKFFTAEAVKQSSFIEVTNKGKTRRLILRNDLRKELKAYMRANGIKTGLIFRGRKDPTKPASEATIWRDLKKVAGKAKVSKKKVHAHSFRHLFALRWIDEGGSVTDLADILGHSRLETTRIYTKTTDEMKKKKIESMKYKGRT